MIITVPQILHLPDQPCPIRLTVKPKTHKNLLYDSNNDPQDNPDQCDIFDSYFKLDKTIKR